MAAKWKGADVAPVVGGFCTKHREPVTPLTRVCMTCHHEALAAAGFDWEQISELRADMGGATGFNKARLAS